MRPNLSQVAVNIIQALLIAGGVTLAVIAVTRFMGGPSLSINQITTNKQSTFDVTGESNLTTIPDQAEVRMGIIVNQPTVKGAQDQANQVINNINSQLGTMGIEKKDIKTENYSLSPNYDFTAGTQRITGYSVNASLVVTMRDFAQVNQAVDMATNAGANQINGISFSLSDDKKAEAEKEARQLAIDDAKEKAESLASLSGMKLGRIVNVWESPQDAGGPYPMMAREAMVANDGAKAAAPTNIEPGSSTFKYQVTLSYETL